MVLDHQTGAGGFADHSRHVLRAHPRELDFLAQVVIVGRVAVLVQDIDRAARPGHHDGIVAVIPRVRADLERPADRPRIAHAVNAHAVVIQHVLPEGHDGIAVGAGQQRSRHIGDHPHGKQRNAAPHQQAHPCQDQKQDQKRLPPAHFGFDSLHSVSLGTQRSTHLHNGCAGAFVAALMDFVPLISIIACAARGCKMHLLFPAGRFHFFQFSFQTLQFVHKTCNKRTPSFVIITVR